MNEEVMLGLHVASGLLLGALAFQEARQQRTEALCRSAVRLRLFESGIASPVDLRQEIPGSVECLARIERRQRAEHHAANATTEGVLDHPRVSAALAHAQSEAGQPLVEVNFVKDLRRGGQAANGCRNQLQFDLLLFDLSDPAELGRLGRPKSRQEMPERYLKTTLYRSTRSSI
jgi:hypothetical protein